MIRTLHTLRTSRCVSAGCGYYGPIRMNGNKVNKLMELIVCVCVCVCVWCSATDGRQAEPIWEMCGVSCHSRIIIRRTFCGGNDTQTDAAFNPFSRTSEIHYSLSFMLMLRVVTMIHKGYTWSPHISRRLYARFLEFRREGHWTKDHRQKVRTMPVVHSLTYYAREIMKRCLKR